MGLLESFFKNLIITPETIGRQGEKMTAATLGWVSFCGRKGKVLLNVYVPRENGETTEIDLLYLTQKGIFVLESKNYSGYIFGNEHNRNWTVTLYAGKDWLGRKRVEKHSFYNPVWQNRTHIKELKQYLGRDVPMISGIIFSERCELKDITIDDPNLFVCNRDALPRMMRQAWNEYPDVLDEEQIETLYQALLPLTNQDRSVKEKHIADIRTRLNSCPRCGGELILRTARQGPNAGGQFFGCSNYPKCRYTKNLES
jgi:hypothetical protein